MDLTRMPYVYRAALAILAEMQRIMALPEIKHRRAGLCELLCTISRYNLRIYDLTDANVSEVIMAKDLIKELWKTWPKYSGDEYFPIPAPWWHLPLGPRRHIDYFQSGKNFTGHRLRLRKQLVQFCIDEIRQRLERVK